MPPRSNKEMYVAHALDIVKVCSDNPNCKTIVIGDYNLPDISLGYDLSDSTLTNSQDLNSFISCLSSLNFFQHNNVRNANGALLDLAFSDLNYINLETAPDPLLSLDIHHPALQWSIPIVYCYVMIATDLTPTIFVIVIIIQLLRY